MSQQHPSKEQIKFLDDYIYDTCALHDKKFKTNQMFNRISIVEFTISKDVRNVFLDNFYYIITIDKNLI